MEFATFVLQSHFIKSDLREALVRALRILGGSRRARYFGKIEGFVETDIAMAQRQRNSDRNFLNRVDLAMILLGKYAIMRDNINPCDAKIMPEVFTVSMRNDSACCEISFAKSGQTLFAK